jgi:hypothetical protein
MATAIGSGDLVFIDTSRRHPSPAGIFAIFSGGAELL